jgi:DNA modification methylase
MSGIYHRDDIPEDLRCYFVRAEIGLEPTTDEYVAKLVAVFREVRRVLRDDGTLWLNIGDSYANGGRKTRDADDKLEQRGMETRPADPIGIKPKDLIGIPWRLAFALQADGWYLRQDIIWHKPNPMPESVNDRCTKAHEYLFLLSKTKRYYYDAEAIKEDASQPIGQKKQVSQHKQSLLGNNARGTLGTNYGPDKRNRRSVWTIATQPYSAAHFATFPPKLIEPCILAGSKPGDVVLDPFSGSGTTAAVATSLGRKAIGIELNPDYQALAQERITQAQRQADLFQVAEDASRQSIMPSPSLAPSF